MTSEYEKKQQYKELEKLLFEREAIRSRLRQKIAALTAVVSSMGLAIVASQIFSSYSVNFNAQPAVASSQKYDDLAAQIIQINKELKGIKDISQESAKLPENATDLEIQQQEKLKGEISRLDSRISSIENIILENPERALSIPLMRKDISESKNRLEEYKASTKIEFDRLYEQQKWMLSGIGAVLLTIATGAITVLIRSFSKSKDSQNA